MLRNVCDLNGRSALSKLCGFHPRDPGSNEARHSLTAWLGHSSEPILSSARARTSPHRSSHARAHAYGFLHERRSRSETALRGRWLGSPGRIVPITSAAPPSTGYSCASGSEQRCPAVARKKVKHFHHEITGNLAVLLHAIRRGVRHLFAFDCPALGFRHGDDKWRCNCVRALNVLNQRRAMTPPELARCWRPVRWIEGLGFTLALARCAVSRTPSARATFSTVSKRGLAPGARAL